MERKDTELLKVYTELKNKVIYLNTTYKDFITIFYEDEHNIEVLKKCGKSFWGYTQNTMFNDLILQITKLMDPMKFSNKKGSSYNLSFAYFCELLSKEKIFSENSYMTLKRNFLRLKVQYKHLKEWRDKRITHTDLNVALEKDRLPDIKYKAFDILINSINDFMYKIGMLLGYNPICYKQSFSKFDAKSTISALKFTYNNFSNVRFLSNFLKGRDYLLHTVTDPILLDLLKNIRDNN